MPTRRSFASALSRHRKPTLALASAAVALALGAGSMLLVGFGDGQDGDGFRDRDPYRGGVDGVDAGANDGGALPSTTSECIGTRKIDHDDRADLCVGVGPAACGRGEYRVDDKGLADRCRDERGKVLDEVGCAPGFQIEVMVGRDECTRRAPPSCPDGMRLRVQKGEDDCVPPDFDER